MARKALIIGVSGTGKSTSIETLNPETTFIIQALNKSLPFKGWKKNYTMFSKDNVNGNYLVSDNPLVIVRTLDYINDKMPHIETIVIDDWQYTLGNEYMRRAKEKGFEKFQDIATNAYTLLEKIDRLRDNLTIFVMAHPEIDTDLMGSKTVKAKTVGNAIDKYITVEGMFTVVLYTNVDKLGDTMSYSFVTQNSGINTGKTPKGMFDTLKIPNDLELVRTTMINYEN